MGEVAYLWGEGAYLWGEGAYLWVREHIYGWGSISMGEGEGEEEGNQKKIIAL